MNQEDQELQEHVPSQEPTKEINPEPPYHRHDHHSSGESASPKENAGQLGLAISSMILGIVSLEMLLVPVAGFICGVIAIVFAIIVFSGHRKEPDPHKGKAVAGLVMGIIGLVPTIFVALFIILGLSLAIAY